MSTCDLEVSTLCRHFGSCGGCSYQNVPYDLQLERKEESVRALFPDCSILPIIGCEEPWQWRNKMEFSFSQSKEGEHFLGLMMRGKRGRVVTLEECLICSSWFATTLQEVMEWWEESGVDAYFPPKDSGLLRTLTLREGVYTSQKMAMLTVAGRAEVPDLSPLFADFDSVILRRQLIEKGKPTRFEESCIRGLPYIEEQLGDYRFRIHPSTFFQPNSVQAERLYRLVADWVEGEVLLDLFCGGGAFGIFASDQVKRVIGIELQPGASENIELNGIVNMEAIVANLDQIELPSADCAILDPPRAGLGPHLIERLNESKIKKLIYVSCNPKSQARDIAKLSNYMVTKIQPFDQFPHTPHIENIALLESLC